MLTLVGVQGRRGETYRRHQFPPSAKTDADMFENNLLEVMQFVFNHTTFDPDNETRPAVLAAYKPLGVVPGQAFDPSPRSHD